jgi:transposase
MIYTESFKAKMVQRLSAPNAISAVRLSRDVGVSRSQLSRWLVAARTVVPMSKNVPTASVTQASSAARSASEKVRIVMAAAALGPSELGAFLRREAVLEGGQLALEDGGARPSPRSGDGKRIKELERELRRKDKALAEAAALLVLQKKVRALWGDGDDDTDEGNEK